LYEYVHNRPINLVDPLGLWDATGGDASGGILQIPIDALALGVGLLAIIADEAIKAANSACQELARAQYDRTEYECNKLKCPNEKKQCLKDAFDQFVDDIRTCNRRYNLNHPH